MHNRKHKSRHQKPRSGSIDGFVPSSGQLGARPIKTYQPDRGAQTPNLGEYIRRPEGFNSANASMGVNAHSRATAAVEAQERGRLADETIVLDDDFEPAKEAPGKKRSIKRILKRSLIVIGVLLLLVGGFLTYKFNHSIAKVFHGNIFSILHTTKLKGEDQGRVTILLAGNSADDPGHSGAQLTDSIMLISVNTKNNTGYLLSIPRDLWVKYGTTSCSVGNSGKINAVYECGQEENFQQSGYPNGGMGLLEKDVNQYFGVNVNYYALVNYSAFRDAVNALGGINFTVKSSDFCPILGTYGLYDGNRDYTTKGPLVKLANGSHVLNGQAALDLARARGDPPYSSCGYGRGDFTRTQNQRQMLLSLKSKALSVGTLSNPVRISSLFDVLGNNVQTDFHIDEVKRLYDITKNIPNNQLQSVGLADDNVNLVRTGEVGNQSVVVPVAGQNDFSKIRAYIQRVSSNDGVVKEGATVSVLNGSDAPGLAAKTASGLTDRGLDVIYTGDAATRQKTVIVAINTQKTATRSYLERKFGVTAATNAAAYPEAKYSTADFVIILGNDAATQ